ncbi:MAG: hypothetical protein JO089_05780 [Alphaproteobacteria bacterium]|nr:hypothetical protein [Alphaproteobacteria bacterium]
MKKLLLLTSSLCALASSPALAQIDVQIGNPRPMVVEQEYPTVVRHPVYPYYYGHRHDYYREREYWENHRHDYDHDRDRDHDEWNNRRH